MTINLEALNENLRNKKHITVTHGGGITTMFVNSRKATYKGIKAIDLSDEMKKKFENVILFSNMEHLHQIPKIIYR